MIASTCTTASITIDKSAYWIPDLYYQWPNGTFSIVPVGGITVYPSFFPPSFTSPLLLPLLPSLTNQLLLWSRRLRRSGQSRLQGVPSWIPYDCWKCLPQKLHRFHSRSGHLLCLVCTHPIIYFILISSPP